MFQLLHSILTIFAIALAFDSGLHPTVDVGLWGCIHFVPIVIVIVEKEMVGHNFYSPICIVIHLSAVVAVALVGREPV